MKTALEDELLMCALLREPNTLMTGLGFRFT